MEQNYVEILLEEMRGKFDLVLEGHAALRTEIQEYRRESNERHDLTELLLKALAKDVVQFRSDVNELRTDVNEIRTDLAAHRADTEGHSRYLVRE